MLTSRFAALLGGFAGRPLAEFGLCGRLAALRLLAGRVGRFGAGFGGAGHVVTGIVAGPRSWRDFLEKMTYCTEHPRLLRSDCKNKNEEKN